MGGRRRYLSKPPILRLQNLEVGSSTSFVCKLLETTIFPDLFQHIRDRTRYEIQKFSSFLNLIFIHSDDFSLIPFTTLLRRMIIQTSY